MSEEIELNDLDNREKEDVVENEDETDFGGREEDYSLLFGPEYYIDNNELKSTTDKYFLGRFNDVNSYLDISHRLLKQLPEYSNPKFIKYLFKEQSMKIKKTISVSGLVTNYELSLNSKETD